MKNFSNTVCIEQEITMDKLPKLETDKEKINPSIFKNGDKDKKDFKSIKSHKLIDNSIENPMYANSLNKDQPPAYLGQQPFLNQPNHLLQSYSPNQLMQSNSPNYLLQSNSPNHLMQSNSSNRQNQFPQSNIANQPFYTGCSKQIIPTISCPYTCPHLSFPIIVQKTPSKTFLAKLGKICNIFLVMYVIYFILFLIIFGIIAIVYFTKYIEYKQKNPLSFLFGN